MRNIPARLCVIAALALAYLWFVDEAIVPEAIAALVVGACTWAAFERVLREERVAASLSPACLKPLLARIPYAALRESLDLLGPVLFRALVRRERVAGRWIALRYDGRDASEGREQARRAFVVFASNLTPNALPLDIDPHGGRMVLHQLVYRRESAASDPVYPI